MPEILYKGIDVSYYQGDINWKAVKESGVEFAMLRAGYGKVSSQKDVKFENNYKGCKENNIPCGIYWYSYAKSASEAELEAKACLEVIKGKKFEFPVLLDMEEESQVKLGKAVCSEICRTFCNYLEKHKYFTGIYTFDSLAQTNLTEEVKKRYAMAVARIGSEPKHSPYYIWQYSWAGKIKGIKGDVDLDYCYIDYPDIIPNAGLNGFEKTLKPEETEKDMDINNDGKVTSADALAILQSIAGLD